MVFQNYALYPHMSVFDNMAFSLKVRRTEGSETRQRVVGVADILGLKSHPWGVIRESRLEANASVWRQDAQSSAI